MDSQPRAIGTCEDAALMVGIPAEEMLSADDLEQPHFVVVRELASVETATLVDLAALLDPPQFVDSTLSVLVHNGLVRGANQFLSPQYPTSYSDQDDEPGAPQGGTGQCAAGADCGIRLGVAAAATIETGPHPLIAARSAFAEALGQLPRRSVNPPGAHAAEEMPRN